MSRDLVRHGSTHASALDDVRDAERAADDGDRERAGQLLHALVGSVDGRHPYLSRRCVELARRIDAHDLELHFALCFFTASSGGRPDAAAAVGRAAAFTPSLERASQRVLRWEGRPEDWSTIAAHDPYGSWPAIAALEPGGRYGAPPLDELRSAGVVDKVVRGHVVAWRVKDARLTWTRHCWALGAKDPSGNGQHGFVPELSDHNCGAALRWLEHQPAWSTSAVVGLVVSRFSLANYYHWIVDGLYDVFDLEVSGVLGDLDRIVIGLPGPAPAFIADSLQASGFDVSRFDLSFAPFDVAGATVVKPMKQPEPPGLVHHMGRLRTALSLEDAALRRPTRRLLLSRRDATTRRLTNEHDVEAALGVHGFETIVPGSMTFAEQVAAFSSAQLVVAPHGAALANLAFAKPGTSVVELFPQASGSPCYRDIADAVGLRYARLTCPPPAAAIGDLHADISELLAIVEPLLRG